MKNSMKTINEELKSLGVTIKYDRDMNEYRVKAKRMESDYFTDDLDDAIGTAKMMAAETIAAMLCPLCHDSLAMYKEGDEVVATCKNFRKCNFGISQAYHPEIIQLIVKTWPNSLFVQHRTLCLPETEQGSYEAFTPKDKSKKEQKRVAANLKAEREQIMATPIRIFKRSTFDGSSRVLTFDEALSELKVFRPERNVVEMGCELEAGLMICTEMSDYTARPPAWWGVKQ